MNVRDSSLVGFRVLREVAERGSFTAAAAELGYTQSAVSRRIIALEQAAGAKLFERRPGGVALTAAGRTLLRHAVVALDAVAEAERELQGLPPERHVVRLGTFPSAGTLLLPRALAALRQTHPGLTVTTKEATTAGLVRALRAGTIDLAVLASRPPYRPLDDQAPSLECETLAEIALMLAVPTDSSLGRLGSAGLEDLADQDWIVSSSNSTEATMGVWPGLPGRPRIAHVARDWLTKLHLVATGCGVTTVPPGLAEALPQGVRLTRVHGCPAELRRISLARLPGPRPAAVNRIARVLRQEAARLSQES